MSEPSDSSDWDMEVDEEDDLPQPALLRQRSYTIMHISEIEQRVNELVSEYSELLGISKDEALILLSHFRWKLHKLQDAWLDNELKVRIEAGISLPPAGYKVAQSRGKKLGSIKLVRGTEGCCQICYENNVDRDALQCGHSYCKSCWRQYLEHLLYERIITGTKCPMHSCPLKVPESMILGYLKGEKAENYKRLKCEEFINQNQAYHWCPAPGCNFVVEYENLGVHEIGCKCGYVFCFACGEEAHRPVTCSLVKDWVVKNSAESENITWIIANTKQCPRCRNPIEKNQGCNHMTCRREVNGCGHEFCWLCLGPWTDHNSATGGFYKCNKYDELMSGTNNAFKQEEHKREKAKTELDKYIWYFERYNNHHKAQKIASEKQVPAMEEKMQELHDLKQYPIGELEFLKQAAEQVVKCRRVLKWTYCFGYYLKSGAEKDLFEHLQEKLEENTEHLHELIEKPLDMYMSPDTIDRSPFYQYKSELTNYFQVTKTFMEHLLDGIESGLTA
ncbi:unnamed protein product [Blepharisma stoltei]|uniref:RBR-type E3 ubiquitin transferase n=1 Tax=Blepharisma stoltei TaxID=1481888 RepID=A0AAU9IGH1_9CILI|nr:unnamed protein product [Blepharisma stoltei]